MDLTTRCPQCGTVFQAGLSDLQLRKGYIRCVQCAHIFDGYAEVVSDASHMVPSAMRPSTVLHRGPSAVRDEADMPQVFRSGRGSATPDAEPGDFRLEPQAESADRSESFVVEAHPGRVKQGGTAAPLLRRRQDDVQPSWWARMVRWLARLLLLALIILLAGQLLYVYRAQLAQVVPTLRPWLEQACVPLRCQVPYARDLTQLTITGSALKIQDDLSDTLESDVESAANPIQHFILQATLRNQSEYAQEWPTLVLDLKDAAGTLLVRRNVAPAEYLGGEVARHPFAARGAVLIQVPLTLDGLRINGYQLDLFYP